MPIQVQFRRANTTAVTAYTGANGEMIINTDNHSLTVHDGTVVGGYSIPSVSVTTVANGTSITINIDTTSIATQLNTQSAGTLTVNAPVGTPYDGQIVMLRIKSTSIQTFSWNAAFAGSTDLPLPTSTSGSSKYDYMRFIYNYDSNKWHLFNKKFGF